MFNSWDAETKRNRGLFLFGAGAAIVVVVVVAVLAIASYTIYEHLSMDHQNLHALTAITQYNLQQGKILPLPQAPPATPAPDKK